MRNRNTPLIPEEVIIPQPTSERDIEDEYYDDEPDNPCENCEDNCKTCEHYWEKRAAMRESEYMDMIFR